MLLMRILIRNFLPIFKHMLPLDDPLWDKLTCHNISGREFAGILARYYAAEVPEVDALYEDLLQVICGGDVYDSSFAAAPHFVRLAESFPLELAAAMLGFAIHAIVESTSSERSVDPRLARYLPNAQKEGLRIASRIFPLIGTTCPERGYFEAILLGFKGDFDGYRHGMERIYDNDKSTIESLKLKEAQMNAMGFKRQANCYSSEDRTSWTTITSN